MDLPLADQVRAMALLKYVGPAKKAGSAEFSIAVKDLLKDLQALNFPLNYTPLVCNSIKTKSFQHENNLEITRIEGPKSQTGTRVIVHYRIVGAGNAGGNAPQNESPSDRARRLTEGLRGLLKKELAGKGGAEGFIQWVRSEDEDAA
ncbi:hypothetical protein H7849_09525 [Alloacidobacterium dinghuense]|uniref:Uncharacterized protein n=1 Tax=Alloacidobacterium dinghuense TaxID=2763107 RepID=A0A7G8BNJ5_9BACT|nr:hypothetical protein [Alloacidobacterium dinghuense]QNI34115.1 hypothetical protein H7849_09525 [Alloacidobacterium dinghuense]